MPLNFSVDRSLWPAAAAQQRVALVTGSFDRTIDGVALTLNRLAAHLLRRGHEVLVIAPYTPRQPVLQHAGVFLHLEPSFPLPIWSEYRLTLGMSKAGFDRLAAFRPTVLHIAVQDAMGHAAQRWGHRNGLASVCSHHTRFERYLQFYSLPVKPLEAAYWSTIGDGNTSTPIVLLVARLRWEKGLSDFAAVVPFC
ncbi:MAG: hypothetical protein SGPRY_004872 [Prymnesium sp.]